MKLGERIESSFDGKPIKLKWRTTGRLQKMAELGEKLQQQTEDAGEEEASQALYEYYREASDVMFEFDEGLPDVEWFARDEFPAGQFDFLRQVFMRPQASM